MRIVRIKVLFVKLVVYCTGRFCGTQLDFSLELGNAVESSAAPGQSRVRWEVNLAGLLQTIPSTDPMRRRIECKQSWLCWPFQGFLRWCSLTGDVIEDLLDYLWLSNHSYNAQLTTAFGTDFDVPQGTFS